MDRDKARPGYLKGAMTDRMTWRDSALAWSTDDPDEMHTDPELAVDREMIERDDDFNHEPDTTHDHAP